MVGMAEAGAVFGSLKATLDIAKCIHSLKSETDINQAVIEIQRMLLEAQQAALADQQERASLVGKIAELERKIDLHNAWENEKDRYRLAEFSEGRHAYVLKEGREDGEPKHKLCAKCYNEGRKSILQTIRSNGGEKVRCQTCKEDTTLTPFRDGGFVVVQESRGTW
jgi:hypothetical protein